jgi:hypothetical protein
LIVWIHLHILQQELRRTKTKWPSDWIGTRNNNRQQQPPTPPPTTTTANNNRQQQPPTTTTANNNNRQQQHSHNNSRSILSETLASKVLLSHEVYLRLTIELKKLYSPALFALHHRVQVSRSTRTGDFL